METTQGFYKFYYCDCSDKSFLLYGPNYVLNANYELRKEDHLEHTYPVDGWYWFDGESDAKTFFGIPEEEVDQIEVP